MVTNQAVTKNENYDGDRAYEPPIDGNRNFLNVSDSFVDEDDNI